MTEALNTGGVDGSTGHDFDLPDAPEGMVWTKIDKPLATTMIGKFVLACRMFQPHPHWRVNDGKTPPPVQQTEYGEVKNVNPPLADTHPAHASGYIHMAPRDDGIVGGTRVLPVIPMRAACQDPANTQETELPPNDPATGYTLFELQKLPPADTP